MRYVKPGFTWKTLHISHKLVETQNLRKNLFFLKMFVILEFQFLFLAT